MKINNYILEPEPHALDRFCLKENYIGRGLSGNEKPRESVRTIGYGMSLIKCLRVIAFRDINELNIQDYYKYQEAYEKKMDSLAENLKPIEKMLYEYMEDKRPKKEMSEGLRKYQEKKKHESI